jgi:hypothetical protein
MTEVLSARSVFSCSIPLIIIAWAQLDATPCSVTAPSCALTSIVLGQIGEMGGACHAGGHELAVLATLAIGVAEDHA